MAKTGVLKYRAYRRKKKKPLTPEQIALAKLRKTRGLSLAEEATAQRFYQIQESFRKYGTTKPGAISTKPASKLDREPYPYRRKKKKPKTLRRVIMYSGKR